MAGLVSSVALVPQGNLKYQGQSASAVFTFAMNFFFLQRSVQCHFLAWLSEAKAK